MTGQNKKENKADSTPNLWLLLYNIFMTAGWLVIGIGICLHIRRHRTHKGLYVYLRKHMLFFQTFAIFEILHAAIGIVRSNTICTTLQVFSRVGLIWCVVEPVYKVQDTAGVVMLMVAWTITELVRYFFYTFNLIEASPYLLLWLRYTMFIVLYPLGVVGELLTIYKSLPHVAREGIFSVSLPNIANFSFYLYYVLIGLFPVYFTVLPQVYMDMFAQRKKTLFSVAQHTEDELQHTEKED